MPIVDLLMVGLYYISTHVCFAVKCNDTCDGVPTSSRVVLPEGCNVATSDGNVTSLDVGECWSEACVSRDDTSQGRCCAPVRTEQVEVRCDSLTYTMVRIVSCGCGECRSDYTVDVTGSVGVPRVKPGTPWDLITEIVPVNASLLVSNGIDPNNTQTFGNGLFSFEATPQSGVIVIRFYQESNVDFLPQVVSIDVQRGVSVISRQVVLQAKPEPTTMDASLGGAVEMPSSAGPPTVTIPPGSVVDADGDLYNGQMKVYATFADPRFRESIASAPGEFTFIDSEGESRQLQTSGVLGLFLEADDGRPLRLSGTTELRLDADPLGIGETDDGKPDSYVWTLDPDQGNWKTPVPLCYDEVRRRRRAVSREVTANVTIPYPLPYINLDTPAMKRILCTLVVQVYADTLFTHPIGDMSLQVVTKSPNTNKYIGYTSGSVNRNGRACVPIMCGYDHLIIVKPLLGEPIAHPTHHLPAGFPFTNSGAIVSFT